jgi:hypothetical protein
MIVLPQNIALVSVHKICGCVGLRQCCHLTFVGESVLNHKMAWPNKRKKLKVILAILMILRRRRKSRYNASCRKMWEKTWIQRRGQLGIYHTLVQKLALEDAVCYKQYFRMSQQLFRAILEKIAPAITKQTTKFSRLQFPGCNSMGTAILKSYDSRTPPDWL